MTEKIIIRTDSEEKALIPDKWVLGTGLYTAGGKKTVFDQEPYQLACALDFLPL